MGMVWGTILTHPFKSALLCGLRVVDNLSCELLTAAKTKVMMFLWVTMTCDLGENVSQEQSVSIVSPEDGNSKFLRSG